MSQQVLIILLVGGAISATLFIYSLLMLLFASRMQTGKRLKDIKRLSDVDDGGQVDLPVGHDTFGQRMVRGLGNVTQAVGGNRRDRDKQKLKLQRAGVLLKPEEFNGIKLGSVLFFALLFGLLSRNPWFMLLGIPVGLLLPELVISLMTSKRAKTLNSQLPEALNVIANGVRAGFSFPQAVAMIVEEMDGPIAEEFGKLLRENSLGKPMEEALQNLSDRTGDEDLDIVITALLIQRQVGGSLAEILDTISETIRGRVKLKGDIRTLTAQGKMSAVIVSIMPFAMAFLLNLVNPGYMNIMFTDPIGIAALVAALVFMALGIFLLSRIIQIKV